MSSRFDHRSVDTFKKHIKFSTKLESYFFHKWLKLCEEMNNISISNARDNGIDNTGEFIEKGKTSGADYMVDLKYGDTQIDNMPLEIKWVPTHGKLTLKEGDLKAYVRENAAILFIYSSEKLDIDLRMPKDYDLKKHILVIESIQDKLRWAIMIPEKVKNFFDFSKANGMIKSIHYMGGKPGVVLKQSEFNNWFSEEKWII